MDLRLWRPGVIVAEATTARTYIVPMIDELFLPLLQLLTKTSKEFKIPSRT